MEASLALQRALWQRLQTLGIPVHDVTPQAIDGTSDAAFPYVKIGAMVPAEWDTTGTLGFDFAVRLHVFSRQTGYTECKTIQGQIYDLLHRGEFAVEDHYIVNLTRETTTCEDEGDGTVHGVCTYNCLLAAT